MTVTALETPDGVELRVADTGPGIASGERARVVERFVRLEASRNSPGTGLGLSLVAAVARLHDAGCCWKTTIPACARSSASRDRRADAEIQCLRERSDAAAAGFAECPQAVSLSGFDGCGRPAFGHVHS